MFSALASGAKALGLRFTISGLLPFALLVCFIVGLTLVVQAPDNASLITVLKDATQNLGVAGVATLIVIAFLLAAVTEPFQITVVRMLEGYWGIGEFSAAARSVGIERQRRRRYALQRARLDAEDRGLDDAGLYTSRLEQFPRHEELLPTALGNALRAGERRAGERYGLDTVSTWPGLYFLLPEPFRRDVGELHGQVDGGARLCIALALAAASSAPVLILHGWWNAVWICAALLSLAAYRGAVATAANLRVVLSAAYDVHRFDLLSAMHLPLPDHFDQERERNGALSRFLAGRAGAKPLPPGLTYAHPPAPPVQMPTPPAAEDPTPTDSEEQ